MAANLATSRIALFVLAMLMVFANPAVAAYDSAVAAYEAGSYDAALREFERLARQGDDRARYYLGLMHKDGKGVAADPVGALVWFLCAATNNSELAGQISKWRDRLTAGMKPSVAAAAERRAGLCRTGAVVGGRSGEPSSPPFVARRPAEDFSRPTTSPSQQWSGFRGDIGGLSRRALWFRIFYFPAHASLNGLEFLAEGAELYALKRDLRVVIGAKDGVLMGVFALLWWIMILRLVWRFCQSVRGTERQAPSDKSRIGIGAAPGWRR